MFVRKKVNKSGIVSIKGIIRINGKSELVKTIGSSRDDKVVTELVKQRHPFIAGFWSSRRSTFQTSKIR